MSQRTVTLSADAFLMGSPGICGSKADPQRLPQNQLTGLERLFLTACDKTSKVWFKNLTPFYAEQIIWTGHF